MRYTRVIDTRKRRQAVWRIRENKKTMELFETYELRRALVDDMIIYARRLHLTDMETRLKAAIRQHTD